MKHILVPTDFSACAGKAMDFAIQTAKKSPVNVTLLHAFEVTGNTSIDYMGINKEYNQSVMHELEEKLAGLKSEIGKKEGIIVSTYLLRGTLNEAILKVSAEKNIDLIVMGTLGASGIKEKLWGSKTAAIIGNSRVPVLVVPDAYEWKKPERLLLATNHFEKEPAILDFLFDMADAYKAKVHVVVFTNEAGDKALTFLEHTRKTPQYEKILKEQYKGEAIVASNLFGNAFEDTLQDYIEENEIDMLAMVTYQRSFWDRIFHPSLTKRMSYHTTIPLLAIPAKQ